MAPEVLSDDELDTRLQGSGWRREDDAIARDLEFGNFGEAMAFVNRVADLAEAENHHPDILVHGWNKVRLTLSTHSAGGVTEADFGLAGRLDELG
jgi:4a-hydroxytetrahydrobiopterin dehydratase